jgi:hypothetical protein
MGYGAGDVKVGGVAGLTKGKRVSERLEDPFVSLEYGIAMPLAGPGA